MHDKPGGQLTAWERQGYRFDYCMHWLVGTDHGVYREIWEEIGAIDETVEIINHRTFIRMEDEYHGVFTIYNDLHEWEAYLISLAPEDERPIRRMCKMMRKGDQLDGFEDPPGMRNFLDYCKAFLHMGSFLPVILKYGKYNCSTFFEKLGFKNERLLYFLNKLFGGSDFSALGFLMVMGWGHAKNAGYLKGGSLAMSQRIAQKFQHLGGQFRLQSRVVDIIIEENVAKGVELENGETLYADHIIGACDGKTLLFDMLRGQYLTDQLREAYEEWPLFEPLVLIGIGVNDSIISLNHNTNYYCPRRNIGSTELEGYSIMNRCAYDPTFAPPGKTTLLFQFESPWKIWKDLKGNAYLREKQAIQKDVLEILEQHYPGITRKIELIDIATPLTTVRYTGVMEGAYEGFKPVNNVLDDLPSQLPGLENFSMAGQWLFPGGGLPPSAQSGKWAIQILTKEEHQKFVAASN